MKIDSAPRSDISPLPEREQLAPEAANAGPEAAPPSVEPESLPGNVAEGRPVRQPLSRRARVWLTLAILAGVVLFALAVQTVLQPFIWATVIAYVLNPIVSLLQRRTNVTRGIAVSLIMLVVLGLAVWGLSAAIPALRRDIAALSQSLTDISNYLTTYIPNAGAITIAGFTVKVPDLVRNTQSAIADLPHMLVHGTFSVAAQTLDILLKFFTFLISTFYLLLDAPRLGRWARDRLPEQHRGDAVGLAKRINTVLSEYLRAEVILIAIMSVASFIALSILNVRFALVLAPIVGFLEIFPIIGPFFAIAMVSIVALIGPPNFGLSHVGFAIVVALVFFILRQIEDYGVIPKVVGHAVKLHPVLILFALLSGASLGGILGMFLAVPVTGAIKVLGSYAYDRIVE